MSDYEHEARVAELDDIYERECPVSDPVDRPILIQCHPCPECQGWDVRGSTTSNHTRSCTRRPARWSDVDDLTGRDRRVAAQALRDAADDYEIDDPGHVAALWLRARARALTRADSVEAGETP